MDDKTEIEVLRELRSEVRDFLYADSLSGVHGLQEASKRVQRWYDEEPVRLWRANRPAAPATAIELARWHIAAPSRERVELQTHEGRLYIITGYAMLVVDAAAVLGAVVPRDLCGVVGSDARLMSREQLERLLSGFGRHVDALAGELANIDGDEPCRLFGDVGVKQRLLEEFVPDWSTGMVAGPHDPVFFAGPDWRAVVMPTVP